MIRKCPKVPSFLVGILFLFIGSYASGTPLFPSAGSNYELDSHIYYLEDPNKSYDINQILSPEQTSQFQKNTSGTLNVGLTKSAWWVYFDLQNSSEFPVTWFLEIAFATIDTIELYVPKGDGSYRVLRSGDLYPFEQRPVNYRYYVLPLELSPPNAQRYYLRVTSESALQVPLKLWSKSFLGVPSGLEVSNFNSESQPMTCFIVKARSLIDWSSPQPTLMISGSS